MSSLFEDASILCTPNAYKAGKLYSIKPTNGDGDLDVVRATTATRVNSAGLIETVANNVPRLDYTNGNCPSILVEPQRTNLILRSEEFENVYWTKQNVTVTPNTTTAPDGTNTADLLTPTSTGLLRRIYGTITSGTYTASIYLKSDTGSSFTTRLVFRDSVNNITQVQNITVSTDWQRFNIIFTTAGTTGFEFWIGGSGTLDTGKNLLAWGAQLEEGSNATSYIPTVASAVTRNADVISKTGISSLIGQTEGTLFAEFNRKGESPANQLLFGISDGTVNNRLRIITTSDFEVRIRFQLNGNITQYDVTTSGGIINSFEQQVKIAFAYKSGDIAVYINGVLFDSSSNTLTIANTLSEYNMSSTSAGSTISQALLFKTRLTNAQLEALTTL